MKPIATIVNIEHHRTTMNNKPHRRKSLRLPGFDYTQPYAYFVTICTHQRRQLFGAIYDGAMQHSSLGTLAVACWAAIPTHYPGVLLDEYVVMPDHLHGMLILPGGGATLGTI